MYTQGRFVCVGLCLFLAFLGTERFHFLVCKRVHKLLYLDFPLSTQHEGVPPATYPLWGAKVAILLVFTFHLWLPLWGLDGAKRGGEGRGDLFNKGVLK